MHGVLRTLFSDAVGFIQMENISIKLESLLLSSFLMDNGSPWPEGTLASVLSPW
jgi:hypothetical protein